MNSKNTRMLDKEDMVGFVKAGGGRYKRHYVPTVITTGLALTSLRLEDKSLCAVQVDRKRKRVLLIISSEEEDNNYIIQGGQLKSKAIVRELKAAGISGCSKESYPFQFNYKKGFILQF